MTSTARLFGTIAITLASIASGQDRLEATPEQIRSVRILEPARAGDSVGHSHNDYYRDRPLFDALDAGMVSIEADIMLVEEGDAAELYVAHDPPEIGPGRTLRAMYLDPVWELVTDAAADPDHVSDDKVSVILMIDIKTEAERTYEALRRQLERYEPMLTVTRRPPPTLGGIPLLQATIDRGPVTVVLSGNRPIETVREEQTRLVAIDGRLPDLGEPDDSPLFPVISNHWRVLGGLGRLDAGDERLKDRLTGLAARAEEADQDLRFWAAPDTPAMWQTLLDAGVQIIHTDRPAELGRWLDGKASEQVAERPAAGSAGSDK